MTGDGPGVFLDPGAAQLLAVSPTPRRALFLDRDGVINVDQAYVHRSEDTEWVPGIFELCHAARDAGYLLVVVTNQAGIARGLYNEARFRNYTQWMHGEFARRGVPLLATWFCPHHPDFPSDVHPGDCSCRKPKPGMLLQAARDYDLDMPRSLLVGDKNGDLQAGQAAGVAAAFKCEGDNLDDAIAWMQQITQEEPQST